MNRRYRSGGRKFSFGISVLIGVVISLLVSVLTAGILAMLIEKGSIDETGLRYGVITIQLMAALLGTLAAKSFADSKGAICALTVAGVYFAVLLAVAMLFFDGVGSIGWGIAAVAIGGGVPALLQIRKGGNTTWKKRRFSR